MSEKPSTVNIGADAPSEKQVKVARLAEQIHDQAGYGTQQLLASGVAHFIAENIIENPQAHGASLYEADAIRLVGTYCLTHRQMAFNADGSPSSCRMCGGDHVSTFVFVPPHEHEWIVGSVGFTGRPFERNVVQRCKDESCGAEDRRVVDARTIVVPA